LLAGAGQARDAEERRAHLAVLEGEVQQGLEHARHGARDALLALLAAASVGAALDRLEGVEDAGVGVAVDPEPGGGEKGALAPIVDEVWPLGHGLVVQALDEGVLLIVAGLAHEVGRGAAEVLLPPRRAVGAARRFDPRGRGLAGAFRLGEQAGLIRRQVLKRHAFSFGLQDNPPEGARTISGKAPPVAQKNGLVSDRVFGEYGGCQTFDIPRLCRDTGPPLWRVSCFWGFDKLRDFRRDSPNGQTRLVRRVRQRIKALRR